MGNLDIGRKIALRYFLKQAMALLFPDVYEQIDWSRPVELLDKELQQLIRDGKLGQRLADVLAKVYLKSGQELRVVLHVEVQGRRQEELGRRMYVYNYRSFDSQDLPVASFAVLADNDPT